MIGSTLTDYAWRLERLAARERPALDLVFAPWTSPPDRLAVISGSFNPLTRAHGGLAMLARRAGWPAALLAISVQTIDKAEIHGLPMAERLALITQYARRRSGLATGAFNQGLYVAQARALRDRLPSTRPTFVLGYDKIVQIFDPDYYDDREAALAALFELADIAVAPRGPAGVEELNRLLAEPRNAPFAARVFPLAWPARWGALRELSATEARLRQASGEPTSDLVPWETTRFLRGRKVYG